MSINKILVSQSQASETYTTIRDMYGISMTFRPFIKIEEVGGNEFRKNDINFSNHSAVIITSKHSIDNYFRMAKELKFKVPDDMKYFCQTEQLSHYLKKYIVYRKRKIFFGERSLEDLLETIKEKGTRETFFYPTSNVSNGEFDQKLDNLEIKYQKIILYKTVFSDLSDVDIEEFDVILFFTPFGIESLLYNFPSFKQKNIKIGVFGGATKKMAEQNGLRVDIISPTIECPSMTMALRKAIEDELKIVVDTGK